MMNHQLPLSSTRSGLETLASFQISEAPITRAWVKGILFRHWLETGDAPPGVLWKQPAGIWCEAHEFKRYADELVGDWGWAVRNKPDWLAPKCPVLEQVLSRKQLKGKVEAGSFDWPTMFSGLTKDNSGNMREDHRLFIVPDGWA
jgi:hypothetical protein